MKTAILRPLFVVGIVVPLLLGGCAAPNTGHGQTSSANGITGGAAGATAADVTNLTRPASPMDNPLVRDKRRQHQVLHDITYTTSQVTQIERSAQLHGIEVPYVPTKNSEGSTSRLLSASGENHVLRLQFPNVTVLNATYFDDIRRSLEPPGQILKLIPEDSLTLHNGTPAKWWKFPFNKGNTLEMLTLQPQGKTWVALLPSASKPADKAYVQTVADTLMPLHAFTS